MGFYTTLDFKGNKQINIDTNGREHYPITVILSAPGDGTKLSPLIILKDEPGKSVENNSRKLPCVINKNMYIFYQAISQYDIFNEWIFKIFLHYQNSLGEKCLLILDKASSHSSDDSQEI